jgi:hypothetical protein
MNGQHFSVGAAPSLLNDTRGMGPRLRALGLRFCLLPRPVSDLALGHAFATMAVAFYD